MHDAQAYDAVPLTVLAGREEPVSDEIVTLMVPDTGSDDASPRFSWTNSDAGSGKHTGGATTRGRLSRTPSDDRQPSVRCPRTGAALVQVIVHANGDGGHAEEALALLLVGKLLLVKHLHRDDAVGLHGAADRGASPCRTTATHRGQRLPALRSARKGVGGRTSQIPRPSTARASASPSRWCASARRRRSRPRTRPATGKGPVCTAARRPPLHRAAPRPPAMQPRRLISGVGKGGRATTARGRRGCQTVPMNRSRRLGGGNGNPRVRDTRRSAQQRVSGLAGQPQPVWPTTRTCRTSLQPWRWYGRMRRRRDSGVRGVRASKAPELSRATHVADARWPFARRRVGRSAGWPGAVHALWTDDRARSRRWCDPLSRALFRTQASPASAAV